MVWGVDLIYCTLAELILEDYVDFLGLLHRQSCHLQLIIVLISRFLICVSLFLCLVLSQLLAHPVLCCIVVVRVDHLVFSPIFEKKQSVLLVTDFLQITKLR